MALDEIEYCINIALTTDKFGKGDTGFELTQEPVDGSKSTALISYPIKSLKSNASYVDQVCVPAGRYMFNVYDTTGDGLCCKYGSGSFSVAIDGEEIIFGGNFRAKSISYEISPGLDPVMNNKSRKWLIEHNSHRKASHEEHNTEYRPLHWNRVLEESSSKWADKVLDDFSKTGVCKHSREPKMNYGENASVKRYSMGPQGENEEPGNILDRWSTNHQMRKTGYPENQTMTQVMWRSSRFVGCTNKYRQYEKDGSYCHVSICRYSRPGNCSMGKYDSWLDGVLQDRTACGEPCPNGVCY